MYSELIVDKGNKAAISFCDTYQSGDICSKHRLTFFLKQLA